MKPTKLYLCGVICMAVSSFAFAIEAILFNGTMPTTTFFCLMSGLFFLTLDCRQKEFTEYTIFNGAQFVVYAIGGFAAYA